MPLRAKGSDGKDYYILKGNDDERNLLLSIRDSVSFKCPHCDAEMLFINATTCIFHFRHVVECIYQTEPESERHLEMKRFFTALIPGALPEQKVGNRIADVYLEGGVVVECQVSPMSIDEISARTLDYSRAGHPVMWVWGHRNAGEFVPADCFATEREKFIQMMCGQSLYYTDAGLFTGKLFGYGERKKELVVKKITSERFKLIKNGEYEFVTMR